MTSASRIARLVGLVDPVGTESREEDAAGAGATTDEEGFTVSGAARIVEAEVSASAADVGFACVTAFGLVARFRLGIGTVELETTVDILALVSCRASKMIAGPGPRCLCSRYEGLEQD